METFNPSQLKELRLKQGITITALAKRLGTSTTQVHRLENGLRRLTVTTLFEFCDALNSTPADLFEFSGSVPVTGVVDDSYEVLPLTPTSPKQVSVSADWFKTCKTLLPLAGNRKADSNQCTVTTCFITCTMRACQNTPGAIAVYYY